MIEHVPPASSVTVAPETAQTAGELDKKVTVSPELATALNAKGDDPRERLLNAPNVIVCGAAWIVNVAGREVAPLGFITVIFTGPALVSIPTVTEANNCCDALRNDVLSALPLHSTVEPEVNPVPFTVRVNACEPATAVDGLRLPIVGAGKIVNVAGGEVVPLGLRTVTFIVPAVVSSPTVTEPANSDALINAVLRAVLPHSTVDPGVKPAPFTAKVNACEPATTDDGLRLLMMGDGRIVNVAGCEVAALGFITVTLTVPAVVSIPAAT